MRDIEEAASLAIELTKARGLAEIGPDELLLGCLLALSRFGVARIGAWAIDLEALGVDWLRQPEASGAKVAYSDAVVAVLDRAARIARADGAPATTTAMRLPHLLAAFAGEDGGLMGRLKSAHRIDSAGWRAAAGLLASGTGEREPSGTGQDEYLTPESAAEALGIHVQTLRAYVRSGKLPALRLAGERAIRIRRADLAKVLEPLVPEKQLN